MTIRRPRVATLAAALSLAALACAAPEPDAPAPRVADPAPAETAAPQAYVVDVVAEDYAFQAPDSIPSGWVTFRMQNEGEETHFIYLTRLTGGHTYEEYVTQVGAPIAELMDLQAAGELTQAEVLEGLGTEIPAWYWTEASPQGGPGMTAPGGISQATVQLEPGLYIMECFMKTPDGVLHWVEGMIRPLVVTTETSGAPAPTADLHMTLRADAFIVDGELTPGVHTVALTFEEHPEVGFGNDVHLARLDPGMDAESLLPWLDFLNPHGLRNPAPVAFLGGSQERPEGNTLYFTVQLEPGRYAWTSEGPEARRMVQEFTVPE
ncbi:MAG TPA: hypothetical protein VMM83_05505 [Longimicrobiales bacterium]|nr:hypothetical protein [Longimicrobiales bacterium]